MTGRRVAVAIIGLLLVGLAVWVVRNTSWVEIDAPTPFNRELLGNPFVAAQRLAETLGARARRDGVFTLPEPDDVLVASNWSWALTAQRRRQIEAWVEGGGRLVVDDSLYDGSESFAQWSGIRGVTLGEPNDDDTSADGDSDGGDFDEGEDDDPFAEAPPAPAQACRSLAPRAVEPDSDEDPSYVLCGAARRYYVSLRDSPDWRLGDETGVSALRVKVGRGSVTAVAGQPFLNPLMFAGDHAAIFVAATQMRAGDQIVFLYEDAADSLITLAWRHGSPVVLLAFAVIALWLLRSAVRFGPALAPPERTRRSLAEQIRGTGQFAVRWGGGEALHRATVRALHEAAAAHIAAFARLPAAEQAASIAAATGFSAGALGSALEFRRDVSGSQLASAIALLESARRALLNTADKGSKHGI